MIIYLALLFVPIYMAWTRRQASALYVLYFSVMVTFLGLRDSVGADWISYMYLFAAHQKTDIWEGLIRAEPLFFLLNKIADAFDLGVYFANFICAFFFLAGVISLARKTSNSWLAIAVITPYLIYIIGLSGIRQSAAIGIIYLMLARWPSLSMASKLLFVFFAAGFHASALLFVSVVVVLHPMRMWIKIPATALTGIIALVSGAQSDQISKYSETYISQNLISGGAWAHVALVAFPSAIYLAYRKRLVIPEWSVPLVRTGSLIGLVALPLILVSSTGVDRATLYFSYVQMFVYPSMTVSFQRYNTAALLVSTLISLGIFFIYFLFGNYSDLYVPYKNILLPN